MSAPALPTAGGATIATGDPLSPAVADLLARHLQLMRDTSPPESVHALDPAALAGKGIRFYVLSDGGAVVGMGALKALTPDHAEIKSMHIAAEARGRGHARRMVAHLIDEARTAGFARLSLETGVEPAFAPARALYAAAGFAECPPFADYVADPNSVFMTLTLG
ncbi:GNAT family N-acetyltransferase [Acidimangrovimonas sediminis]|uniref:GNAT family N-acetyltransferase n=1 Tax=Acidimangrovimonas sediminis TaxID=2056283 RepID=UPI000C7FB02E|nr:GNAT family N-acetyltransferase [Acidimangrovimonas sediminis]